MATKSASTLVELTLPFSVPLALGSRRTGRASNRTYSSGGGGRPRRAARLDTVISYHSRSVPSSRVISSVVRSHSFVVLGDPRAVITEQHTFQ